MTVLFDEGADVHYVNHFFGMGHTIIGALKLYNGMTTEKDEIKTLLAYYAVLNDLSKNPTLYQNGKIPVIAKYIKDPDEV